MNRDVVQVERAVYNQFMLLGDVGGLYGIFVSLGSVFLGFINYQKQENELSENLYKVKKRKVHQDEALHADQQFAIKEYFQDCAPSFCLKSRCCRRSAHDKYLSQARDNLTRELDVVNLLQQIRFFDAALRYLLPMETVPELKKETERVVLKIEHEGNVQMNQVTQNAMDLTLDRLANITADDNRDQSIYNDSSVQMNIDNERNIPTIANQDKLKGSISPTPPEEEEPKHNRDKDQ